MAYTKKTWANGDAITPTNLNNMEDGIADIHSRIQSGVATLGPIAASEQKTFTITFPTTFTTTPVVSFTATNPALALAINGAPQLTQVSVTIKNTTANAYSSFPIYWIAIQP